MPPKLWLVDNWFKIAVLLLLLLGIVSAIYYLFVFQPRRDTRLAALQSEHQIATETPSVKPVTASAALAVAPLTVTTSSTAEPSPEAQSNPDSLSKSVLEEIMGRVVLVKCYGAGEAVQGSGTAGLIASTDPVVITNFHVLSYAGGTSATCTINTPNPPDYSPGDLFIAQVGLFDTHYPDVDAAVLHIQNVSSPDSNVFQPFPLPFCDESKVSIGDKVTLFGYPALGGTTITVTDGIISGLIKNQYGVIYKTSALMDHGISGGLAVRNEDSCVLGIPTWGVADPLNGASLGLIQFWDSIKNSGQIFNAPSSGGTQSSPSSQPVQQSTYTPPTPAPNTPQEDETAAENYWNANHTCVGLSGNQYDDCITYAYNH